MRTSILIQILEDLSLDSIVTMESNGLRVRDPETGRITTIIIEPKNQSNDED